jgi:RNA polymerase sigma factor (sigma-70 family)
MKFTTIREDAMTNQEKTSRHERHISATGESGRGSARRGLCGDSATLEEIWRTHSQQILRVTQRITNNPEDAEDALQDSFLRAHVSLHTFDGRASIVTWLTRIAINSALMILRKRKRVLQVSLDDGVHGGAELRALIPPDPHPSPEARFAEFEEQGVVRVALGSLRPSIRRALELRTFKEQSIRETAATMGLSITATKSRIFHAKAALRKSLRPKVPRRPGTGGPQVSTA